MSTRYSVSTSVTRERTELASSMRFASVPNRAFAIEARPTQHPLEGSPADSVAVLVVAQVKPIVPGSSIVRPIPELRVVGIHWGEKCLGMDQVDRAVRNSFLAARFFHTYTRSPRRGCKRAKPGAQPNQFLQSAIARGSRPGTRETIFQGPRSARRPAPFAVRPGMYTRCFDHS
jgi:hypothetical protein